MSDATQTQTMHESWSKQEELHAAMGVAIEAYMREVFHYQRDIRGLGMFGGTAHFNETRELAEKRCEGAIQDVMQTLQVESL